MKWNTFLTTAYPDTLAASEAHRSAVYKINRWIGLGLAYVCYHLGISANVLSVARLILALLGFYLISLVAVGSRWYPLGGVVLLVWQIHLDAADGALARVFKSTSALGDKLDGLANAASRAAVIMLAGYLTTDRAMFVVSAFVAYVLVTFIPDTGMWIRSSGRWRPLALLYRMALFVPIMVFVLPLAIGLHGVLQWQVAAFARVVVLGYAALAALWLLLCLRSANVSDGPLESSAGHG